MSEAIDVEQLINEVQRRVPLWDQSHKNHHNRLVIEKLWNQIATKMNTRSAALKKRWKNLRDHFRIELRKLPSSRSANTAAYDERYSGWKHFDRLGFLKSHMKSRQSSGNLPQNALSDDNSQTDSQPIGIQTAEVDAVEEQTWLENHFVESDPPFPTLEQPKNLEDISTPIQKYGTEPAGNEDENFFFSLLSHMKKLKPEEKLRCHMDIQKTVYDYVYGEKSSSFQRANLNLFPDSTISLSSENTPANLLVSKLEPPQ